MPAMGLAREWLVSYTMLYVDPDNWLVRNSRLEVENKLNKMAPSNKDGKSCNELIDNMVAPDVINIPHIGGVIKVWSTIREIRNHVLHCGMREDPVKVDKVLSIVQNLPELIYGVLDEEYYI